jgi:hypothetical protein
MLIIYRLSSLELELLSQPSYGFSILHELLIIFSIYSIEKSKCEVETERNIQIKDSFSLFYDEAILLPTHNAVFWSIFGVG